MSRFMVFSDIHIHPWASFAKMNEYGVNSRLWDIIMVLRQVINKAEKNNCEGILFSGDLFHIPKIDVTTLDLAARTLRRTELPIVMIPGNHDEASKMAHFHSMRALGNRGNVKVLDRREGDKIEVAGCKIGGIPFLHDNERMLEKVEDFTGFDILLLHSGFEGAKEGFDYIADQKKYPRFRDLKLRDRGINIAIAGHFHNPHLFSCPTSDQAPQHPPVQTSQYGTFYLPPNSLMIPGAPIQHTFGDRDSLRGCWIIDTNKLSFEFKRLKSPKFVKVEGTDWEDDMANGNYVSCVVGNSEEYTEAYDRLNKLSRGFSITQISEERDNKSRMKITPESSRRDIIRLYTKKHLLEGFSRKRIVRSALRILKEADAE